MPSIGARMLGVAEADVGLGALGGGGRLEMLRVLHLAAAGGDLFGVGAGHGHGRALGLDLALERFELGRGCVERGTRLIRFLRRGHAPLRQPLGARRGEPRILEIGGRGRDLGFGRGEHGFRLSDLIGGLPLLQTERGLRLAHLGGHPGRCLRVIRVVSLQLVGRDHREPLILRDPIAFLHHQLGDLPGDLRADDHVVGGDQAGQDQRRRWSLGVAVDRDPSGDQHEEQHEAAGTGHRHHQRKKERAREKQLYETTV